MALSPFAALQARARFEAAHAGFGDTEPMGRILAIGAILATHYLEFDHGQVDRWIDLLLPQLEHPPPYPAPAAELRVNAALLFALSFARPRADLTDACVARLRTLLQRDDIPVNARVDAATLMLAYHQINGEFDESDRIVAMASPWAADPRLTPSYRALWLLQLAHFRDKQGNDAEALKIYDQSQAIANDNALMLPPLRIFAHLGRAIAALCAGDAETAEAERVRAEAYWTFARKLDRALDGAIRTWIALLRHEYETARKIAREVVVGMDDFGPVWLRLGSRLLLAIAEFEVDPRADLAPILEEARAFLPGSCLRHHIHAVEAVEAWVQLRRGGPNAARAAIERSVAGLNAHHGQFMLRMHPTLLSEVYGAALQLGVAEGDARRAIREYALRAPDADTPRWPWLFEVRTLGRFEVLREGQPLAFSRKVPKKTLALLKAIIALGGRSVSEQRLLDALWPDEEGDAGARALDATVLRLRTLLGDSAAVVQRGGRVTLDPERVWVDVFAFDRALAAADEAAHRHEPDAEAQPLQRALELYSGAFLVEDEGEPWPVAARERLRGRFIHALARQAERHEAAGDDTAAIALYMRGIDADPAIESFYQGLMRCYERSGRRSEAIAAYQRLRQILSITLGLQPSASSERLYQALKG